MSLAQTILALVFTTALCTAEPVTFNSRTTQNGKWSEATTWEKGVL